MSYAHIKGHIVSYAHDEIMNLIVWDNQSHYETYNASRFWRGTVCCTPTLRGSCAHDDILSLIIRPITRVAFEGAQYVVRPHYVLHSLWDIESHHQTYSVCCCFKGQNRSYAHIKGHNMSCAHNMSDAPGTAQGFPRISGFSWAKETFSLLF